VGARDVRMPRKSAGNTLGIGNFSAFSKLFVHPHLQRMGLLPQWGRHGHRDRGVFRKIEGNNNGNC